MEIQTKFPPLKWAQNQERIFITIEVADCENLKVDIQEEYSKLQFSSTANGIKYEFELELFKPVVKEESKWNTKGRNILINLSKKEKSDEEWWPRLTQSKSKNPFITIDWARWREADDDEDDNKDASGGLGAGGMGDFDPNNMNDFQNMMGGNMGGDSDDEEEEC